MLKCPSLLLAALCAAPLLAQLPEFGEYTAAMGHLHCNVSNLEEGLQFFKTLGGVPMKIGRVDYVRFPDVLVLLRKADPSGGTEPSAINHVGFKVKDLKGSRERWEAAGLKIVPGSNPRQLFVMGPGDLKIEMTEDTAMTAPIANHHIHFYTASVADTQAWYVKMFGAKAGKRGPFEAADLPGVNLSFSAAKGTALPTKGRSLDHIGFEIKDLAGFCKKLESAGVKFDVPFRDVPDLKIKIAFFTDPWGTYVELTEGLNRW